MRGYYRRIAGAILVLGAVLQLCGCGASETAPALSLAGGDLSGSHTASGIKLRSMPPRFPEHIDIGQVRAEVAAAGVPDGITTELWQDLTTGLLEALDDHPGGKQSARIPFGEANRIVDLELSDSSGTWLLSWTYVNLGDYDQNSEVSVSDLTVIGRHFGAASGDPDWPEAQFADGDSNGMVTVSDITPIGRYFFCSVGGYNIYARSDGERNFTLVGNVLFSEATGDGRLQFAYELGTVDYTEYMVAPCDSDGNDTPQLPLVATNTVVLDPELVTIASVTEDAVVLSGETASIAPGQVLVSGEGEGLLRIVETVEDQGGSVLVHTSQGTLEDVFDFAVIQDQRILRYSDLASWEAAIEGVTIQPASEAASAAGGKATDASLIDWQVVFPEHELGYGFKIQGAIGIKIDMVIDIEIGGSWFEVGTLERFRYENSLTISGGVTIKWATQLKLNNSSILLGTMVFGYYPVLVGFVPVIITPMIDAYMGFEGTVEMGLEMNPTLSLGIGAGVEYTRTGGWDPFSYLTPSLSLGVPDPTQPNAFIELAGTFNLFSPAPSLKVYGVAGPYVRLTSPYFKLAAKLSSNPSQFQVYIDGGVKASVGAKVALLGHTLADYNSPLLVDFVTRVWERSWPLDTEVGVLAGTAVDAWTDEPLSGVVIDLFDKDDKLISATETDEEGAYAKTLPTGDIRAVFAKPDYLQFEQVAVIAEGQTTDLDVLMEPDADYEALTLTLDWPIVDIWSLNIDDWRQPDGKCDHYLGLFVQEPSGSWVRPGIPQAGWVENGYPYMASITEFGQRYHLPAIKAQHGEEYRVAAGFKSSLWYRDTEPELIHSDYTLEVKYNGDTPSEFTETFNGQVSDPPGGMSGDLPYSGPCWSEVCTVIPVPRGSSMLQGREAMVVERVGEPPLIYVAMQ